MDASKQWQEIEGESKVLDWFYQEEKQQENRITKKNDEEEVDQKEHVLKEK